MPLDFKLIPDNREISEILAAQVQGAYRFVHDAMKPYVRVEPSGSGSITVTAGAKLRLQRREASKQVTGPIDFAVMFYQHGLTLAEVSTPDARVVPVSDFGTRELQLGHPAVDVVPEGGHEFQPVVSPRRTTSPTKIVAQPSEPSPNVEIPAHLRDLCTREELHPELGDYLIIPESQVTAYQPLPSWVATTKHVDTVHVRKPRIGYDSPIGT